MSEHESSPGYSQHLLRSDFIARLRTAIVCVVSLACLAAVGCDGSHGKSAPRERSNLKTLAVLYGRFLAEHHGQPPADEAEFKKFVRSLATAEVTSFGIEDPDQLFVSTRDRKPYIVVYGQVRGSPGPASARIIAYEQEGIGGKRLVATALGGVREVDQTEFRQCVPSATMPRG